MCKFVLHPLLFPSRGRRTGALYSKCKTNQVTFRVGYLYYCLISWRKSALIQKPSVELPKTFHQQGIVTKTKNDLGINALI